MKSILRALILLVVRLLGLPGALAAARGTRAPLPAAPRILLVRPDHLGDLLLTTPAIGALKASLPEAQMTMLAGPWSREIAAHYPTLDEVRTLEFPGFRRAEQGALEPYILLLRAARELRRGRYDLAINLRPDFWWGAALLYLARIPRRIGYAIAPGAPFLTHALPFTTPEHSAVSSLRLVSAALETLGRSPLTAPYTPERYPLQFMPSAEERVRAEERLEKAGIGPRESLVVIHPGSGAAVKLWRTDAWITCAKRLMAAAPVRIALTGSPNERAMLEEIARGITVPEQAQNGGASHAPLLVSDASIGELAALLQRAQLVLGVDSGPLHLAVAVGTPTVQIYGPADPRIFGPWGTETRHLVIAATQCCPDCPTIPCGRLDIAPEELAAHPCVRLVPETQVLQAISRLGIAQNVV